MRRSYLRTPKKPSGKELFERRMLATEILLVLEENNFKRCERLETKYGDVSEIVYAKPLKTNSRYMVAVYTSCDQVGGAYVVKKKGSDAIRIAGLYINDEGIPRGIIKNIRVNRTGDSSSITKRMMTRVVKTFHELNTNKTCDECGSPKFISKKGNLVCSEACWSKK
tara:strand:+ start:32 stop:532 length:501 start_codon:yes stop_codon:yes gene_type:complete